MDIYSLHLIAIYDTYTYIQVVSYSNTIITHHTYLFNIFHSLWIQSKSLRSDLYYYLHAVIYIISYY